MLVIGTLYAAILAQGACCLICNNEYQKWARARLVLMGHFRGQVWLFEQQSGKLGR